MKAVRNFGLFWYDFIVGDDLTIAIGVVIALALTALLARHHVPAWWLVPAVTGVLLVASVGRVARAAGHSPPEDSTASGDEPPA
jgi:hypothetical protein